MSDMDEFVEMISNATVDGSKAGSTPQAAAFPPISTSWARQLAAASCWARTGDSYFPVSQVQESLPAGAFNCRVNETGPFLEKMSITIDHLLTLPDAATDTLLAEFAKFWTLRDAFDKRGFTFKRGMLMWGPPGSGKTSSIWQMVKHLIEKKSGIIVFINDPQVTILCLTALRRIEPHRPIVTVSEDLDALVQSYGEHNLLALYDGEFQLNNVVHLATTNYPDRLDRRFIDRPSRFDTIMKVGMPSEAARRVYFSIKEPDVDEETRERWVFRSEGYSIAHLREICIATQCLFQDEDEVFARLDKMRQLIQLNSSGDDEKGGVGFLPVQAYKIKHAKRNGLKGIRHGLDPTS